MCQLCYDALTRYFPLDNDHDPGSEGMFVLWNLTAFPFSSGEETVEALRLVRFKLDNYLLMEANP